ncbi:MAG: hypothetical protein U0R52_05900 [Solirubrobacterales bacterium]
MSSRVSLGGSAEQVAGRCARVLTELGWDVATPAEGRLVGEEDPAWVPCKNAPSRVSMELRGEAPGRTEVSVTVSAPGFGPPAAGRLRRQLAALEERLAG